MDNSVDNSDIGRSADIFPLGQAIENIGRGVLVTGVMGGVMGLLLPTITFIIKGLEIIGA